MASTLFSSGVVPPFLGGVAVGVVAAIEMVGEVMGDALSGIASEAE